MGGAEDSEIFRDYFSAFTFGNQEADFSDICVTADFAGIPESISGQVTNGFSD